jgi:hypothetical protein
VEDEEDTTGEDAALDDAAQEGDGAFAEEEGPGPPHPAATMRPIARQAVRRIFRFTADPPFRYIFFSIPHFNRSGKRAAGGGG